MLYRFVLGMTFSLLLIYSSNSYAQVQNNKIYKPYIGVTVGMVDAEDINENSLDFDIGGNVFLGYRFTDIFALELGYSRAEGDFGSIGDISVDFYEVMLLFYFPYHKTLWPYIQTGFGYLQSKVSVASASFKDKEKKAFVGIGVDFKLSKDFVVRAGLKTMIGGDDLYILSVGPVYQF